MSVVFLIESTALLLLALLLRQHCAEPSRRAAIGFAAIGVLPLLALAQLADLGWHPLTQHLSLDATAAAAAIPEPVPAPAMSPWTWLWIAYGTVTLWRLLQWWHGQRRVRGWLRETRPCSGVHWQRQSRLIAEVLGHRAMPVLVHALAGSPFLLGLRRPRVVIPAYLEHCSEARARLVLLHEFAHRQARDPLRTQLVDLICCLLWFQPLLQRVRLGFRADIELACDDRVLRAGSDAHAYAETIALCAGQQRLQGASLVGMALQRNQLVQRVERILDAPDAPAHASLQWPLLVLCGVGMLSLGVNFAPRVVVEATAASLIDATSNVLPVLVAPAGPPAPFSDTTPAIPAVTPSVKRVESPPPLPARAEVQPRPTQRATAAVAVPESSPPQAVDAAQLQRSISHVVALDAQRYAQEHARDPLPDTATTQTRFEEGFAQARAERDARRERITRRVMEVALGTIPLN